jgi:hypothetical protein
MPAAERARAPGQPDDRVGTALPLVACGRCGASGRVRDAEFAPLDDQGRLWPASVAAGAWLRGRLVEELPPDPTAPCPVCHGHRLVTRRGRHRPYASGRAAEQADRRGTASTCAYCHGSGLAGRVAVWQPCSTCSGTGRVLGWADVLDPVVPEGVDLEQPTSEAFLGAWLAAATWTVTRSDPPPAGSTLAKVSGGPAGWARDRLVGVSAEASLVSVWAPDAGWEAAPDAGLVGCAQALLAARRHPLALRRITSELGGRWVATGLQVELLGGYGWRVTVTYPPALPTAERPVLAVPSPSVARWLGLDPPARRLLAALYDEDQQREEAEHADRRDSLSPGRPAATWRWIDLDDPATLTAPPSAGAASRQLPTVRHLAQLLQATPADQLAAPLDVLAARRLVDRRGGPGHGQAQLTRLGRQAVRAGLRKRPRGRPPAHLLRGGAWAILAELFDVGDQGVHPAQYAGSYSRSALDPLRYQPDGPLVEEISVPQPIGQPVPRVRLTPAGRSFYERAWAEHDRWYPGVRATPPPGTEVVTLPPLANSPK